jgi:uncharacterized membrane protein
LYVPVLWSAASGWRYLPEPAGYQGGRVLGLNAHGDLHPTAVRWTAAGAELLPALGGQASSALALSDQGHVLKAASSYGIGPTVGEPSRALVVKGLNQWSVGLNGRDTALVFTPAQSRAFIWKDGVMSDLTTLVASKGVKVSAGAAFVNAVSINAKGSMVAEYIDAAGKYALVRLTAKP